MLLLGETPTLLPYFLEGSLAPDMGVFPGCRAEISELSHYQRTGELTQLLIKRAESDAERAFAVGWLSHYLADIALHPLINAAVGKFVNGANAAPLPWSGAPDIHLRIELGFDGAFALRQPSSLPRHTTTQLPERLWQTLHAAYLELYGRDIPGTAFKQSHCRALGFHERLLRLAEIQAARSQHLPIPKTAYAAFLHTYLPLRAVAPFLRSPAMPHALVHLEFPPDAFYADAVAVIQGVIQELATHAANSHASLPNLNLDTGEPC